MIGAGSLRRQGPNLPIGWLSASTASHPLQLLGTCRGIALTDHVAIMAMRRFAEGERGGRALVEYCGGERSAEAGAGIEVEPVRPKLWHAVLDRGMAVYDEEAMVARIGQERLANPGSVSSPCASRGWHGSMPAWTKNRHSSANESGSEAIQSRCRGGICSALPTP